VTIAGRGPAAASARGRAGGAGVARRMVAPAVFGLAGVAVLLALGFWQLARLEWKQSVLAAIEARMAAPPAAIPPAPSEAAHEYLRVAAAGELLPGELHVYTSAPPRGVGYRVIAPLALADGRRVLLDRGFVPIAEKGAPRRTGPIRVEGMLLWPDETDRFTSPPDRAANVWFARDVALMAAALGTEPAMVVAAASDDPAGPVPLPVGVGVRNPHLEYAVTWFGLALVWAVMTAYLLWRIKRRID
jgi:surfeit locus 1 family protein